MQAADAMPPSTALEFERGIAKKIGAHVAHTTAISFDALQVSLRAAIPASSLSSDALAVAVASLYDSHTIAWQKGVAAVADARAIERANEGVPLPGAIADSNASAKDELAIDVELLSLCARLRNANVATEGLLERKHEMVRALAATRCIASRVPSGNSADGNVSAVADAKGIVGDMQDAAVNLEAVEMLLGTESDSCPLLLNVASAVKALSEDRRDGSASWCFSPAIHPPNNSVAFTADKKALDALSTHLSTQK
jgi:hypothetical protein